MGCHSRKLSSTCWLGCSRRAEAGNRSTTNSETGCLPGKDIGESPSPLSSLKAPRHAHCSALLCQHSPASIAESELLAGIFVLKVCHDSLGAVLQSCCLTLLPPFTVIGGSV